MSKLDPEAVINLAPVKKTAMPAVGPGLLLALSDGFMLALLGWTLLRLFGSDALSAEADLSQRALVTGLMLVPLVKSVFGIYSLGRFDYLERTRRTFQAALLSVAVLAVPFIVMDGFRSFFVEALSVALVGFAITYAADLLLVHGLMASALNWRTPVVIVGAGPQGAAIAEKLQRLPWLGMRPVCFFDDDDTLWQTRVANLPVVGSTELLAKSPAYAQQAQAAIVADIGRHGADLTALVARLPFKQVYCLLGEGNVSAVDATYHNLHGSLALRVSVRPPTSYLRIRRALDILLSGILLVAVAPLMLGIAAAIRLDSPGPVMFRQKRWAGGDKTFDVLKFRSMHINAEEHLQRLLENDPKMREEYMTYHKLTYDPRITPVGRFLRKTSLDELPQLWNILTGDMSLIGPRAYMPKELPEVGASAEVIGSVRPGLTGYWQVSGRHRTTFQERVAMDVFYVRNCGLLFDFYILCKTAVIVLKGDGS
ncbi:exopolysaccharide biosynthesis polyprenyl glycosylphosphotransferase [Azospirillum isscasi]|uniref:Exopolysaccharide biosynthesis polyprenyl glycosylphosphotransferase n=1 Tax=Azospirillum isscasi TaxID=3053926 RepID=A0ABU0WF77_9PROT|nr:exopolysaccharide biosynthesis polyprenyl glycosylphosphotransferase [Azospirillum isscasi]MDQ2102259.1 exopolysaccharide biosynthesis polyprenyl glycosylphosphotransferase [Azospirillum isscasi]